MEINKKVFLTALSQIKAYKNIVVLRDSPIEGCLDILYAPRIDSPKCINRMTVNITGRSTDLFDDSPIDKLGNSMPVYLNHVKNILKEASSCVIENGNLNGVQVDVARDDLTAHSAFDFITKTYEAFFAEMKAAGQVSVIPMQQADYSYMVSELTKFASKDETRYFMNGVCFDFKGADDNFVNIVATDGRKLCRMKLPWNGRNRLNEEYIIPTAYLSVPASYFTTAQLNLAGGINQLLIHTEDYSLEGLFRGIDGIYPNYLGVIPEIDGKTERFNLCAASFKKTIESVKNIMGKNGMIYLNAGNPENLSITIGGESAALEVEGAASRPMLVSCLWEQLGPCLFDGIALTKFYLNGSNLAIQAQENKAVKGITMNVLKLFMPTGCEGNKDDDEFRMPKKTVAET
jgi:hypothetical protein